MSTLANKTFTIVDVETTGGSPYFNRVIEIGLIRVEKGEIVSKYQTLINPEQPLPEFIMKLTGITNKDLKDAPKFIEIKDELIEYFEDSIFVAHNVGFDYEFIRQEFKRHEMAFNLDRLCTVRLSRAIFPKEKHHNLGAIIERFNFFPENRHRAFDDAKVLWQFIETLKVTIAFESLEQAINKSIRKYSKPALSKTLGELEYIPLSE